MLFIDAIFIKKNAKVAFRNFKREFLGKIK
jgi:hypothetical protein